EDGPGQHEVDRGEHERAPRGAILDLAYQPHLQAGHDERHAEDQRRVDVASESLRLATREEDGDDEIEDEEESEERLGAGEVLGAIEAEPPDRADREG